MNSSSDKIQVQALSMLHINILLPPYYCKKNRRTILISRRQRTILQPWAASASKGNQLPSSRVWIRRIYKGATPLKCSSSSSVFSASNSSTILPKLHTQYIFNVLLMLFGYLLMWDSNIWLRKKNTRASISAPLLNTSRARISRHKDCETLVVLRCSWRRSRSGKRT
jgi:hypothetical protein